MRAAIRAETAKDLERVLELFPRVRERLAQRAGTLSGGEQQMVAMARALMGRPRLICMDEPTMGLSPLFVDRVLELIAAINREGVTVFMVEQNASLALSIAHRRLCAADRPHRARGRRARHGARPAHPRRLSRRRPRDRGGADVSPPKATQWLRGDPSPQGEEERGGVRWELR